MTTETQKELKTFSFNDETLKEQLKPKQFTINDTPLYKFEDKKGVTIEVLKDLEILSRETDYGLKYYVPIKVKGETFYFQCSTTTLKKILDSTEENINKLNVMLDLKQKTYSVIPLGE